MSLLNIINEMCGRVRLCYSRALVVMTAQWPHANVSLMVQCWHWHSETSSNPQSSAMSISRTKNQRHWPICDEPTILEDQVTLANKQYYPEVTSKLWAPQTHNPHPTGLYRRCKHKQLAQTINSDEWQHVCKLFINSLDSSKQCRVRQPVYAWPLDIVLSILQAYHTGRINQNMYIIVTQFN